MTVLTVVLAFLAGVAVVCAATTLLARWAAGHGKTAVRREADRGMQDLERFLIEAA